MAVIETRESLVDFELEPTTDAGRRFLQLAEEHAADFATRAAQHDRDGTFPFENFDSMRQSGFLAATVPTELGGLGVESLLDLTTGVDRLARADGSTAIAVTMHLGVGWSLSMALRRAATESDQVLRVAGVAESADALRAMVEPALAGIGNGSFVVAGAGTETGTHMLYPQTTATKVEGGWHVNGHKTFVTLAPIATVFATSCRYQDEGGRWRPGGGWIARDDPGVEILDNWDPLGMRASGSPDVVFTNAFIPDGMFTRGGELGQATPLWIVRTSGSSVPLVGACLGMAEAAREYIVDLVTKRRKAPSNTRLAERYPIQATIAKIEIDLAACRAMLERTCRVWDHYLAHASLREFEGSDALQLMKDLQCTKTFVNRKAVEIVDRAMTASGGAGYLATNVISRLYRDVRACSFMQPFSPNEAFEYIGKVALGVDPVVDM